MSEAKVGVAFVGAGTVAEMHGRGVSINPQAKLIGVYDPQTARAKAIAKKFGGRVFRSLDEILSDKQVEAVHVLTPPQYHVPTAVASLKAGKHVLLEKPITRTIPEIRRLQAAARKASRVCMPAHNYIYMPSIQRAKRLIENGSLGTIASFWFVYNIFHSEEVASRYGGVFRAVCSHPAYSLLYFLGRPRRVMAAASTVHYKKLTCEDQVMMVCEMPGGALANLWCSFAANDLSNDPWTVLFKLLGERGGVTFSWNEAQFTDDRGPGWGFPCYEEGFANEIDHFVKRCILAGEPPLSTLDDALDALRLIEAAERSVRLKRSVEFAELTLK